jgi:hypothetical protein
MADTAGLILPPYDAGDEPMLRSHLRLVHGLYINDEKTVTGLIDCHQADHAESFGRPIRHTHTAPPDADELEEWTWT